MMHVKFWKIVGAYLTGWLIAQPTYTLLRKWVLKRQMENPPEELQRYWRWQAIHVAEAIERRERGSKVCPRCLMPYYPGDGHGQGMCIERVRVDRPLKVLYIAEGVPMSGRDVADADIVYRQLGDVAVLEKDRYGNHDLPTIEFRAHHPREGMRTRGTASL